ncbi:MAG: hypothetical protein K0R80_2804 [Clostridia bacterium]|jgi:hypothetical protein|nr:hypothetical protein [Clostridia bacterium]
MRGKKLIFVVFLSIVLLMTCAFNFDINNGDSLTIFENQVIPEGDIVSGDAVCVFGNLEIKGDVRGDVVAVFGNIDIYGQINGDVVAVFGNVNVHKNAVIGGDTVGVFGNVEKDPGAIIRGEIADTKIGAAPGGFDIIPNMSFNSIVGMIIIYGLACLVVMLFPERIKLMVQASQFNLGRHLGIGLLVLLVTILLIPILIITIIGIIPAILLLIAFAIASLVSVTAVYIFLGQKIAAAVEGKNAVFIHLLIGLVVVNALGMVPILGALAAMAVFFVGLGVAFDTRLGSPIPRKKTI